MNVAARVTGLARSCETLITAAVADAAGALDDVRLVALGPHRLRNIVDPVTVFRAETPTPGAARTVDPVCRMTVDPLRAVGRLRHDGRDHLFCSLECAGRFAANPEAYDA